MIKIYSIAVKCRADTGNSPCVWRWSSLRVAGTLCLRKHEINKETAALAQVYGKASGFSAVVRAEVEHTTLLTKDESATASHHPKHIME